MTSWRTQHVEMRSYLEWAHQMYSEAFCSGDHEGMVELSSELSLAYAALGQPSLAEKWAEEYLQRSLGAVWPCSA